MSEVRHNSFEFEKSLPYVRDSGIQKLMEIFAVESWAELFKAGLRWPRVTARFKFRFGSLKSISVFILFVNRLMIGRCKNNRENYPRKCFWAQEKETRVKFNPRLSANRAFEQLGPGFWNAESVISRLKPESKSHWQRIRNPVPEMRNPLCGIQNPESRRLSWIPLHGAKGPIRRSELTLNWTWNTYTRQVKSLN